MVTLVRNLVWKSEKKKEQNKVLLYGSNKGFLPLERLTDFETVNHRIDHLLYRWSMPGVLFPGDLHLILENNITSANSWSFRGHAVRSVTCPYGLPHHSAQLGWVRPLLFVCRPQSTSPDCFMFGYLALSLSSESSWLPCLLYLP